MDLSVVIRSPFEDSAWLRKSLVSGLITLVPIVGPLAQMGWTERWYRLRLNGTPGIPEPLDDLPGDIGRGFWLGTSMTLSFAPLLALVGCTGIAGALAPRLLDGSARAAGSVIILAVMLVLLAPASLAVGVLFPALAHQRVVRGRVWLWGGWSEIVARARRSPMDLLLAFVAVFVGQVIGQLGMLACCIGAVVTLPLAQLIGFAAHAEWARATDDAVP